MNGKGMGGAMDLRPVEAIGAIRKVNLKQAAEDVAPPFAIDGTARMEKNSYSAGAKQQDRGLEQEDAEESESAEEPAPNFIAVEPPKKVNLFA